MDLDPLIDSLVKIQQRLAEQNISSALIGGLTLAVWARARATKDLDLKIMLTRADAARLLAVLGEDYDPISPNPAATIRRNGVLFVRNSAGIRIDLLLAETGFDQQVLQRARQVELLPNVWVMVATAEDIIIYKLISPRPQDQADVDAIIRVQGDALDDAYIVKTLRHFEIALGDCPLVRTYNDLRKRHPTSNFQLPK